MRMRKKAFGLVLAAVLLFTLCVPVLAAEAENPTDPDPDVQSETEVPDAEDRSCGSRVRLPEMFTRLMLKTASFGVFNIRLVVRTCSVIESYLIKSYLILLASMHSSLPKPLQEPLQAKTWI